MQHRKPILVSLIAIISFNLGIVTFHHHPDEQPTPAKPYHLYKDSAYCPIMGFLHQAIPSPCNIFEQELRLATRFIIPQISIVSISDIFSFNERAPPFWTEDSISI